MLVTMAKVGVSIFMAGSAFLDAAGSADVIAAKVNGEWMPSGQSKFLPQRGSEQIL